MANKTTERETIKRGILQSQIFHFIECVLLEAERQGNLDFFDIRISNHQGNLNMEPTLKVRKKVY